MREVREEMNKDNLPTQEEWNGLYAPNGVFAIRKLFRELSTPAMRKKYPPLFTLKPFEYKELPSAYQVYMESIDEYDAALKIVPNMKVWDQLKEASWFYNGDIGHSFEGLKVWREHMKQRDASIAMKALMDKVADGDTTAAKAVLANTKIKAPVGRSNKKTKAESDTIARISEFKRKRG